MMEKMGQLVWTGIEGLDLTNDEAEFISSQNIGGVVLFANNYENPAQLAELVNSIQALRVEYPLFIAVDHEGGRVIRFKTSFTQFPSMGDVARTNSPKNCFRIHQIMAEELSACGINLNLSPCCDILNNPKNKVIGNRSFGSDHETVSKFVSSAIRGLKTSGVMACSKHFPGHGGTTKDSHVDLPVVTKSLQDLEKEELKPFIKAVKSRVDFVMMSHIVVEAIDTDYPCSLSPKAHEYLRDKLKFSNLIITDDMDMLAIADNYSAGESAVMAISAGSDILEYRNTERAKAALEGLKEAVKIQRLKKCEIIDRLNRIERIKKENLSDFKPCYIPDVSKRIGQQSSLSFLDDINRLISE